MPNEKVAILIKKAALVIEKLSNRALAPYELTNAQYKILMLLYRSPDKTVRQIDIEKHFSMTNPTVTGIIQNLERKGLVRRVANAQDKRSKVLSLTGEALSMKEELYAAGEAMEAQVTEKLTHEERQQLIELLKKILPE